MNRGLQTAYAKAYFAARTPCRSSPNHTPRATSLYSGGVPDFYVKLGAVQLPNSLNFQQPPGAKPFVDATMLRYALETAPPLPSDATVDVNGDGW